MITIPNAQAIELKAKLFRGFADSSRLSILETLCSGEKTVTEIVANTGLGQPNVSNHLGCLRDCGLVAARPEGRFTVYRLADPAVAELLQVSGDLLARVARGIYACINYPDGETK